MARVRAFTALRYDPDRIPLADAIAPPYDVITPQMQAELYSRAMQNVVRIELGRRYDSDHDGEDQYARARDYIRVWLEQGFLTRDPEPSLYIHRHTFPAPDGSATLTRLGCFATVEPVPYDRGEVLRHELTLKEPRQDRLRLLLATGVQTSPILLLFDGGGRAMEVMRAQTAVAPVVGDALVEGERGPESHRLWRVLDPAAIAAITEALSSSRLFIADGHHRYETALGLHLPGVLALLAPLQDPSTVILPTHRVLPQSRLDPDELMTALVGSGWAAQQVEGVEPGLLVMAELQDAWHAFLIFDSATSWLVSRRRQASSGAGSAAHLDVEVLNREILEAHLGLGAADFEGGRLHYTRYAAEAGRMVEERGTVGFLLNPPTVAEMAEVSLAGAAMPQKSTYFFPKVPAGLVLLPNQ
ncbi:MAG: DUF1015 family protein [Candidatus Dormibacteria bacterium]